MKKTRAEKEKERRDGEGRERYEYYSFVVKPHKRLYSGEPMSFDRWLELPEESGMKCRMCEAKYPERIAPLDGEFGYVEGNVAMLCIRCKALIRTTPVNLYLKEIDRLVDFERSSEFDHKGW
jgi:hypothetical protein